MGGVVRLQAARVRRWWPCLALIIIGAALAACGGGGDHVTPVAGTATQAITGGTTTAGATTTAGTATPQEPISEQAMARMAIDAVAGQDVHETNVTVQGQPFDIDVVVEDAGTGYQGYQYWLEWDPTVLAYSTTVDLKPEDLSLCVTPSPASGVLYAGCTRTSGDTYFVGPLSRVTFTCIGQGTSPLHLKPIAEDPDFGTSLLTARGAVVATALFDGSVTCEGG